MGLKKDESLFSSQRTIVMDAGIATEDNIALIKRRGFKYVAVSRKRTYDDSFWPEVEDEKITLSDGKTMLSLKLARTEEEVFFYATLKQKRSKRALFCYVVRRSLSRSY